jgi:hypothetical protein
VKRELVDFIERLPASSREDVNVWRVPDGIEWGANGRVHLGTGAEFLARERP